MQLRREASNRDGPIQMSCTDGVFQADGLISDELKQALMIGLAQLEDVPSTELDWHPGSNGQVLDLIHPSLHSYVIGETRVTEKPFGVADALGMIGLGNAQPSTNVVSSDKDEPDNDEPNSTSEHYAWLPAEFRVSATGEVTIESYINNLHPTRHAALYPVLGGIFQLLVPMLERVLTHLKNPRPMRVQVPPHGRWYERPADWAGPEADFILRKTWLTIRNQARHRDSDDDELDDDDEWSAFKYRYRPIFIPDPPMPFRPPQLMADHRVTLAGRSLQMIVKVAKIVLTPEKPAYDGGVWHVEGMLNERIVASAIAYLESDNITESRLAFRQAVGPPAYAQEDRRGVEHAYGLVDEEALNQSLGSLVTQADRCIAFPNTLQHRVDPFCLADRSKPGMRTILVYFLCDPAVTVISTARVPPQQTTWFESKSTALHRELMNNTPLIDVLVSEILDYVGLGMMTLKRAKKHRKVLMKERKHFVKANSEALFEREFSLCEH